MKGKPFIKSSAPGVRKKIDAGFWLLFPKKLPIRQPKGASVNCLEIGSDAPCHIGAWVSDPSRFAVSMRDNSLANL